VDGFPYLFGLAAAVTALAGGGLGVARAGRSRLGGALLAAALAPAVPTVLGARYVLVGKARLQRQVLAAVDWRGDEVVADLGAGRGLLALGAATRTRGPVHAVDLFVGKDLSGNSAQRLLANARAVGVVDRLRVHRADVRHVPLGPATVDVVVSSQCQHNRGDPAARAAALDEVCRIVRPGGTVVISDLAHVDREYAPHLRGRGATIVAVTGVPGSFPAQRLLVARAPGR
jgi:arsenite methyltransferase